jgi:hypothetical protein
LPDCNEIQIIHSAPEKRAARRQNNIGPPEAKEESIAG